MTRNVKLQRIEKGKIIDLCVHHGTDDEKRRLPVSDQVIGFALRALTDEDNLKRVANDQNRRDYVPLKRVAVAA
jgi:hypothetical protein